MTAVMRMFFAFLLLVFCSTASHSYATPSRAALTLQEILTLPSSKIDLAKVKLSVDQLVDPAVDIEAEEQRINLMADQIKAMIFKKVAPNRVTDWIKLLAIRTYLYDAGPWNNQKTHSYDFRDPLGTKIENKLLKNYLVSRRGNCVSMPILFVILGQKLGIDVALTPAPLHFAVVFTGENGEKRYIETTDRGYRVSKPQLIESFEITSKALKSEIYLQRLSEKEMAISMVGTLLEHFMAEGEYIKAFNLAGKLIEAHPKYVDAMLAKATAAAAIMEYHIKAKYPNPENMPVEFQYHYRELAKANYTLFKEAESLGWVEPTTSYQEKYINNITQISQTSKAP